MEKVKGVSSKEATDETYARIRNNKNVIIGEEGTKLADNIPMNDREYKVYLMARDLNVPYFGKIFAHTSIPLIPDKQSDFFDHSGNLKEYYRKLGFPEPENFNGEKGWIVAGFKGEEKLGEIAANLVVRFNEKEDIGVFKNITAIPLSKVPISRGGDKFEKFGNNCNSWSISIFKSLGIQVEPSYNLFYNSHFHRSTIGKNNIISDKYFTKEGVE